MYVCIVQCVCVCRAGGRGGDDMGGLVGGLRAIEPAAYTGGSSYSGAGSGNGYGGGPSRGLGYRSSANPGAMSGRGARATCTPHLSE